MMVAALYFEELLASGKMRISVTSKAFLSLPLPACPASSPASLFRLSYSPIMQSYMQSKVQPKPSHSSLLFHVILQ